MPTRTGGRGTSQRPTSHATYELTFLPGLEDVVREEVADVLGPRTPVLPLPDRDDSMLLHYRGAATDLLRLRTIVAASTVLSFPVPRPKSLSSGEYFPEIVDTVLRSAQLDGARAFRFEAAGKDSSVFQRLAAQLSAATGLRVEDTDGTDGADGGGAAGASGAGGGAVVLRFRRSPVLDPGAGPVDGWDVVVRLGSRPSSAREWRVADYPGAVNATIAAAIVRLAGIRPTDRVLNLMCGSGTLLVERLLAGPVATAVGVDLAPEAIAAAAKNLEAAGLAGRARLVTADIRASGWRDGEPADLVLADPPWGTLIGSHATSEEDHRDLLRVAHQVTRPGSRLVVLTHEVRVMERILRGTPGWREGTTVRVFQKGHHPRIYLLERVELSVPA